MVNKPTRTGLYPNNAIVKHIFIKAIPVTTRDTYCDLKTAFTKIYTLSDVEGNVFYIGNTMQPIEVRLAGHISDARSKINNVNKPKNVMIRELNFNIIITVIDVRYITGSDLAMLMRRAHAIEQEYIAKYLAEGYKLVNVRVPKTEKPIMPEEEVVGFSLVANGNKISRARKLESL